MRISFGGSITVPASAERWFSEMRAGRAFARGAQVIAAAAQFAEIQLFNPVASGKQILVYRALATPGTADTINLRLHNTALATLVGTGVNLLSGGPAAVGEIRTAVPAALDGTLIALLQTPAVTPVEIATVWAAELSPGQGVLISNNSVNFTLTVPWYWNEV